MRPNFLYQSGIGWLLLGMLFGCQPPDRQVALKETQSGPVRVKTVSLMQKDVTKQTRQPATVRPYYETEIHSRVSGYVSEVRADIGDLVKSGQVLAQIDVPEMNQQRRIMESKITALESAELEAQAGVVLSKAQVQSALAALGETRALLQDKEALLVAAQSELDRTTDLVARNAVQQRLLDEAQKRLDSAKASKAAAQASIASIQSQVDVAEAQVAAAEAKAQAQRTQTEVAERELEELDIMLEYTSIGAPFTGIITKRMVNMGDLVESGNGSDPLFVVSQVDKVRIQVPLPEAEAPFVQAGDEMSVSFPAFASEPPLSVVVSRVAGGLNPSTRTILVEAEVDNTQGKLLPGMFGEASIVLDRKLATNLLPSRAVRFDEAGNAFIYVLGAENKIQIIEIATGLDSGTEIEVLTALEPNARVVGPHLSRFAEGEIVKPL